MSMLRTVFAVSAALMTVYLPSASAADSKNQGYLTDRNGNAVTVRSSGCVRSRDWTPARANRQCEGATVTTSSQQPRTSKQ